MGAIWSHDEGSEEAIEWQESNEQDLEGNEEILNRKGSK